MLRGYRCIIITVAGLILLGVGEPQKSPATAEKSKSAAAIAGKPSPADLTVPEQPIAPRPDAGCKEGDDKRESDLCAQWKAADGAKSAAKAAWAQFWVGIAGLFLGAVTMGAAIAAALYAKRAAVATEDTVNLAKDGMEGAETALKIAERNAQAAMRSASAVGESNEIAREGMQRELRAFVFAGKPIITYDNSVTSGIGNTGKIVLVITNHGRTPAYNVRICVNSLIHGIWTDPFDSDFDNTHVVHLGDIPPGERKERPGFTVTGIMEAHDRLANGTNSVIIDGVINYEDAFGKTRVTRFRYASTDKEYSHRQWSETPEGNTST